MNDDTSRLPSESYMRTCLTSTLFTTDILQLCDPLNLSLTLHPPPQLKHPQQTQTFAQTNAHSPTHDPADTAEKYVTHTPSPTHPHTHTHTHRYR